MKKKLIVVLLFLIILIFILPFNLAGCGLKGKDFTIRGMSGYFELEDWMCLRDNDTHVSIMGITEAGKLKEELVIPQTIDGCKVQLGKSIGSNYWESDNLKKLFIPAEIKVSRARLFENCPALEKLIFLSVNPEDYKSGYDNEWVYGKYKNYIEPAVREEFIEYSSYDSQYVISCNNIYKLNYLHFYNNGSYWLDHLEEEETIKTIPRNPEREGYAFIGWYMEKECINKIELSEIVMGTEPIIFYAGWQEL